MCLLAKTIMEVLILKILVFFSNLLIEYLKDCIIWKD